MKKDKFELESFVKENYNLFNSEEPKKGHFDRFKSRLDPQVRKRNLFTESLKYAAVVLFLISAFFIYDTYNSTNDSTFLSDNNTGIDDDFSEVTGFYNTELESKYADFDAVTCKAGDTQKQKINEDLEDLNDAYFELQAEYKMNPENTTVKNALIDNYRMRIDILDMIITTLKNYC